MTEVVLHHRSIDIVSGQELERKSVVQVQETDRDIPYRNNYR